ncbi:metal-dependent hydrolase [Pseudomonas sp. GCM10022188]|uniref:metal-dependent hydrolase n=1 Tax=Pseudomonas TaxID=286 RepID=UPI001E590755|nr:metal-dependent hydrolase [Pseudomonas oryzagri]MCC6074529.1 metal-dependent hydrolase [Pseudomonas oryzagri]
MPFTPLHMGPGILLKSLLPTSLSLMVFGWAQIVMDLQPLVALLTGRGELHGFSHTLIGASLLTLVAALSGKYLGELGLYLLGLRNQLPIRWRAAWVGAVIGTASHVLLDSLVHADIQPLAPFSTANGLFGLVSWEAMEWLCLASGALGGILYLAGARRLSRRQRQG